MAAVAATVVEMDYRDQWRWRLMGAAALDGGHTTTSWHSERAEIHSIVFGHAMMATARNRAMAVALEEEGDGEGKKSNGDCHKVGDGEEQ